MGAPSLDTPGVPHRTDGNQRRQWIAAWRRGRLALVGITMIGLAILLHGLRPDLLIWYWNPYVPLLAYVLFLFACWSVACRDWLWLPVAVVVGSVIVQLHVAYVPLVASAAVATAVVLWLTRRTVDDRKKRAPSRRVVVAAAGLSSRCGHRSAGISRSARTTSRMSSATSGTRVSRPRGFPPASES